MPGSVGVNLPAGARRGVSAAILRRARRKYSAVLAYHSVATIDASLDPNLLCTPPHRFRRQIELLLGAGFEFVTASGFVARCDPEPPPGLVSLTFDDGLLDNLTTLKPILDEYGVPATVYAITGKFGDPYPWTPADSGLRLMTAGEVAELSAAGVEIGAHTVSHPDMAELTYEECLGEMTASRSELQRITGKNIDTFTYPFARHGPEARRAALDAGFDAAFAYGDDPDWPVTHFPRIPLSRRDTGLTMALKIGRHYDRMAHSRAGRCLRHAVRETRRRLGA